MLMLSVGLFVGYVALGTVTTAICFLVWGDPDDEVMVTGTMMIWPVALIALVFIGLARLPRLLARKLGARC